MKIDVEIERLAALQQRLPDRCAGPRTRKIFDRYVSFQAADRQGHSSPGLCVRHFSPLYLSHEERIYGTVSR